MQALQTNRLSAAAVFENAKRQSEMLLAQVKRQCQMFDHSKQIEVELQIYESSQRPAISQAEEELKGLLERVNQAIQASASEEIPEDFYDGLMGSLMTDPYRDKFGHVANKSTWGQYPEKNPFTNVPLKPGDIQPDIELKSRINAHRKRPIPPSPEENSRLKIRRLE